MKYEKIVEGIFISRPNRFIAQVKINNTEFTVHVKNTGRCKELLVPNCKIFLEKSNNPNRKTKYDLVAVKKETSNGQILINMDSQSPNKVAYEWIKSEDFLMQNPEIQKITYLKPEYSYGKSRFDFYLEYEDIFEKKQKMFLEVKGVTLEKDGIVLFPDAPTERGVKHLTELTEIAKKGEYKSAVLFVIQLKGCKYFTPNSETHPQFADALKNAQSAGVKIFAMDCIVTENEMRISERVEVRL